MSEIKRDVIANSQANLSRLSKLQVVVMPTRAPVLGNERYYNEAYETWQLCWGETFNQVLGKSQIPSDDYVRQDYTIAIFNGPVCAASIMFRRIDTSIRSNAEDSYFKAWPAELLNEIGNKYEKAMISSWITTRPEYRRTGSDEHLKSLDISLRLSEMMNFFMQDINYDVTFGTVRVSRSADKMCTYSGSTTILKDQVQYDEKCNLILWLPENLQPASRAFPDFAFDLWNNRIVYSDEVLKASSKPIAENYNELRAIEY